MASGRSPYCITLIICLAEASSIKLLLCKITHGLLNTELSVVQTLIQSVINSEPQFNVSWLIQMRPHFSMHPLTASAVTLNALPWSFRVFTMSLAIFSYIPIFEWCRNATPSSASFLDNVQYTHPLHPVQHERANRN